MNIVAASQPDPYSLVPTQSLGNSLNQFDPTWRDTAGRTQVSPSLVSGQDTVLIFGYGQSLIANHDNDSYSSVSSLNQQFSVENGGIYVAANPNPGASWLVGSPNFASYLTRLGDKLIADGYCARVITVNVAIGTSLTSEWASGGTLNPRLVVACKRLAAVGITQSNLFRTFIIHHQGESHDCITQSISSATYTTQGNSAIATIRNNGFSAAKAFVQLATFNAGFSPTTDSDVRAGQFGMVDGVNTFQGYDLDTNIDVSERYDGTHLKSTAVIAVANGTAAILEAH
jgi:hypothetical protein